MFISERGGYYYVSYTSPDGKRHKFSTRSAKKTDALRALREFSPAEEPSSTVLLSGYADDSLRYAKSTYSPATYELFVRGLRLFLAAVGDRPLVDIRPLHIDQFKSSRMRDVSTTTANIEMRALRSIFSTAIRWNLLSVQPFQKIELPKVPEAVPTYLTHDEYMRRRSAIDRHWLGDLVDFAVLAGMRRGEILNLKWSHIDLERRVIVIQTDATFRTKMGRLRVVPLADTVIDLLNRRKLEGGSGYVFLYEEHPFKGDHVIRNFRKFATQVGLSPKVNFHPLRHTHASWLV